MASSKKPFGQGSLMKLDHGTPKDDCEDEDNQLIYENRVVACSLNAAPDDASEVGKRRY